MSLPTIIAFCVVVTAAYYFFSFVSAFGKAMSAPSTSTKASDNNGKMICEMDFVETGSPASLQAYYAKYPEEEQKDKDTDLYVLYLQAIG